MLVNIAVFPSKYSCNIVKGAFLWDILVISRTKLLVLLCQIHGYFV